MKLLEIIVCIKPVPDPKKWQALRLDERTKTLRREGIPVVINPLDKNALEEGLKIREERGGNVTVLSMAPPSAGSVLREALAMGADRAVLLTDPAFAGGDTLATARVLASAIRKSGSFDLILCGQESLDGSTAQVGSQLAALLGIPGLSRVDDLQWQKEGALHIRCRTDRGSLILDARLPMLISVIKEINHPRYTTFLGILEAEKKEILTWGLEDLGCTAEEVGLCGSPTQMADLVIPDVKRCGERIKGEPEEIAKMIVDRLYREGIL